MISLGEWIRARATQITDLVTTLDNELRIDAPKAPIAAESNAPSLTSCQA